MNMSKQNKSVKKVSKQNKRFLTFFLAIILVISAAFGNWTVQLVDAKTANLNNKGYAIEPDGKGFTIGGHHFDSILYWTLDGKPAYCMEPGKSAHTGDAMKSDAISNLSTKNKNALWYTLYYGNNSASGSKASYTATQGIIWMIVMGKSSSVASMEKARDILEKKCPGTEARWDSIWAKVEKALDTAETVPSFAASKKSKARSHFLRWNGSKYTVTLTDTKGILKEFDFANATLPKGVTYKISGDSITFSSATIFDSTAIEVVPKKTSSLAMSGVGAPLIWDAATGSSSHQKMVQYDDMKNDPINCYFKLSVKAVPAGNKIEEDVEGNYYIEISKLCAETGFGLEGVKYDIYENGVKTEHSVTTDEAGHAEFVVTKEDHFEAEYIENYAEIAAYMEPDALAAFMEGKFASEAEAQAYIDQKVDEFMNTEYTFKIDETQARYGYTLHGYHPQDVPIPEVTIKAEETAEFNVIDHRTEDKVKIKKEDLETGGTAQGDATLEGAVYGLFASAPIVHPDGHTGIVYDTNDLVSTTTTIKDGYAEFINNTEGSWTGKPILLGQYYIKELSRSEGYELSISGINYDHTNNDQANLDVEIKDVGSAISTALYINSKEDNGDDELYFRVITKDATEGYDVNLSNLPTGSLIYKVTEKYVTVTENLVTGKEEKDVVDGNGDPVYITAEERQLKLDEDGNKIVAKDSNGDIIYSTEELYESYEIEEELAEIDIAGSSSTCILDTTNNRIIIKKTGTYKDSGGNDIPIDYIVSYESSDYEIFENQVTIKGQEIDADATTSSSNIVLKSMYEPDYEYYEIGDYIFDENGDKVQAVELVDVYENVTYEKYSEERTLVAANMESDGTYSFHANTVGTETDIYVVVFPNGTSASAVQQAGGAVNSMTPVNMTNGAAGTYIKTVELWYPGQYIYWQDAGTFTVPIIVLQRVIKQSVKITKSISLDSYEYNKYGIPEVDKLPNFYFKMYLVSELIDYGLKIDANSGMYDYKKFFEDNPDLANSLAVDIDKASDNKDSDLTTVHASLNKNSDYWYTNTIALPYGRYIIVEQQPTEMKNKQYAIADPQEITLPFIPEDGADKQTPSSGYFYDQTMDLDDMQDSYNIRLGAESDQTRYGNGETVLNTDKNSLYQTKLADYDGNFLSALIPWSVVEPQTFTVNGKIVTEDEDFDRFVGYAFKTFENIFYTSKLRFEKIDSDTGENIIHEEALFKIYKASRDEATGDVLFDANDCPIYDVNDLIEQYNNEGTRVGIFRAFSTVTEVLTANGFEKQNVGYIETFQPIGAGAYVLVEVQAPKGYSSLKKPVAFEIYSDKITYYPEGEASAKEAEKFEYAVPLEDKTIDLHRMEILNSPLKVYVHKVEDGTETIEYRVEGTEKELLARQKLEGSSKVQLVYDASGNFEGYATIIHTYDKWSEHIVYGTENQIKAMDYTKPIYDSVSGAYAGYGIRFDIYVGDATLTLYEGLEVKKDSLGDPIGITVNWNVQNKVESITASETGSKKTIEAINKTLTKPILDIYDILEVKNDPVDLLFCDLSEVDTENDAETGELYLLDDRGNRACHLDRITGLAYTYDDFGSMIVYPVDANGDKIVYDHIRIQTKADGSTTIYNKMEAAAVDENDLPVYYTPDSGQVIYDETTWITPEGTKKESYQIARIALGAYITEEIEVPFKDGYIQTEPVGFIVKDTAEDQKVFVEDDFTKIELSKRDITTKEELDGATMTLYNAEKVEDDSEKGYHLEKIDVYETWISEGKEPHWIDHIPVGEYILEETIVPWENGYVKSEDIEVIVLETGEVQGYIMEDDYTAVELLKSDALTKDPVADTTLTLYQAKLNSNLTLDSFGVPVLDGSQITYDSNQDLVKGEKLLEWETKTSGNNNVLYADQTGLAPNMKYYTTSKQAMRIDYLPTGFYVLEETVVPFADGYTTATTMLIQVDSKGAQEIIQLSTMVDYPTQIFLSKRALTGMEEVVGAKLSIYKTDGSGQATGAPIETWTSGKEGVFLSSDIIPDGYQAGDRKPHYIAYLPIGDYVLVEEEVPYGFLKSDPVAFMVKDTEEIQLVVMKDAIPTGYVEINKYDSVDPTKKLADAVFVIRNKSTKAVIDTVTTDSDGKAVSGKMPIGYVGADGIFKGITYEIVETAAPSGYALNGYAYEFQFQYADDTTDTIKHSYSFANSTGTPPGGGGGTTTPPTPSGGRLKVIKLDTKTKQELLGATLVLKDSTGKLVDEWVSTLQPHYINLALGTYTLSELKAPDGYLLAKDIKVEVKNSTETISVEMLDDATGVLLLKVDEDNKPLKGASLLLTESNGTFVDQWVTNGKGHEISALVTGKEYVLKEVNTPAGYATAAPVAFTVKGTADVQKVVMVDEKTKVRVDKTDITGEEELEGAKLTVRDGIGTIVDQWISTTKPHYIEGLEVGKTYTLREEIAPEGYAIATDIDFTVLDTGKVQTVKMKDETIKGKVIIYKKDEFTGVPMPNVTFEIRNSWGKVMDTVTTDENGYAESKLLEVAKFKKDESFKKYIAYTLVETKTLKGYQLDKTKHRFTFESGLSEKEGIMVKVFEIVNRPYIGKPKTGDPSRLLYVGLGLLISGAGIIALMHQSRKKKKIK